jgi:hypothetical protein
MPVPPEQSTGLQIGRWRLWVEDQLITYQDFWLPQIEASWGGMQIQVEELTKLCYRHKTNGEYQQYLRMDPRQVPPDWSLAFVGRGPADYLPRLLAPAN